MYGKIRLSDYRCFYREDPAELELWPGFTSLIGPNNAGKSTLIKSLFELRDLFQQAINNPPEQLIRQRPALSSRPHITDPDEVLSERDDPMLSIEIDIGEGRGTNLVRSIVFKRNKGDQAYDISVHCSDGRPATFGGPDATMSGADQNELHGRDGTRYLLRPIRDLLTLLLNVQYVGPYRNAINEGSGNYFDLLVGTSFINQWHVWRTGGNKDQSKSILRVTEDIRTLIGARTLEINASNELKTLQVVIDGEQYKLVELGAGLAQLIVVLGSALVRKPSFILIDEPEAHLHPALQANFLNTLAKYASHGVVFSTHSVGLARYSAERCLSIQRRNRRSIVRPYNKTPHLAEFLGSLGIAGLQELGWDRILLVEGTHDVRVFQQFLRICGDKAKHTVVLPLGGSSLINSKTAEELGEVRRLSPKVFAAIDSERKEAGAKLSKDRQAFADACHQLGIPCHVSVQRATENYLSDRAVKLAFGSSAAALPAYAKGEEQPNFWGKSQNWRAAELMTREEVEASDLGKFLAKV